MMHIVMRPDFDPKTEIVGYVEAVQWFMDINEKVYERGDTYNGLLIIDLYIHPDSDSSWLICKAEDGSIWEFGFDRYVRCGMSSYRPLK